MSILVVEVVAEGLLFAADRNMTETHQDGTTSQPIQQPKVLRWPRDDILLGYVGAARIAGQPMHEWLAAERNEFAGVASLSELVPKLRDLVQQQRSSDEGGEPAKALIMHVGGFTRVAGFWVPEIWYIRNTHKHGMFGYLDIRKDYSAADAFCESFAGVDPSEIRDALRVRAKQFDPFWYHQGIDLSTFNVLQGALKLAFKLLCEQHPRHEIPRTLAEWSHHLHMQVLMYGAYYEAFYPSGRQYVGGGADVLSLPWPTPGGT